MTSVYGVFFLTLSYLNLSLYNLFSDAINSERLKFRGVYIQELWCCQGIKKFFWYVFYFLSPAFVSHVYVGNIIPSLHFNLKYYSYYKFKLDAIRVCIYMYIVYIITIVLQYLRFCYTAIFNFWFPNFAVCNRCL